MDDNEFQFHIIEGIVMAERTNSETHVHGEISGGEGYGYRWSSPVRGSINSYTTKTQEFWLKQNDGKEIHINLSNNTVPIRSGHEVAMVFVDGFNEPCYVYIKNTENIYQVLREIRNENFFTVFGILSLVSLVIGIFVHEVLIVGILLFLINGATYKKNKEFNTILTENALTVLKKHIAQMCMPPTTLLHRWRP